MDYQLPFTEGQKVLELGGGDRPAFRPNLDIRPGPAVDIVADLEQPLPLEAETYDGVFCHYLLEHISWRKVKAFIQEINRVLKPGGVATLFTANTYEQCKVAASTPPEQWHDGIPQMLFGDNDYPENTHRAGFSPQMAVRAFLQAGFSRVEAYEHPVTPTDMIIHAWR